VPIHELDPLTHLIADAVGVPGKRTFFLQAASGPDQVTLLIEKEQVRVLTERLDEFLRELADGRPEDPEETAAAAAGEMALREPLVPEFRVGQLRLVYDAERDRVVIIASELAVGETEEDEDDEAAETDAEDAEPAAREVHLVATRAQLRRLAEHGNQVVSRGRPPCPICGNAMNPGGHVCPAMNGHRPFTVG
jgi:uncharacterized repeat protein (TIGR03847 family)